ncbi:OmpP1/FadL family transporter [Tepidiphilus succinatimandens]|uniref:OmpP1/FadL family transporter n=1 Tax=Tepidiphilus succinatimandens TaxID=224436 RepID=UPI00112F7718|nr:outer membrane protein transport protein [Tepidiphilus succinatimandens]
MKTVLSNKKIFIRFLSSALGLGASNYALATDGLFIEGFGAVSRGMGGTATAHNVGPAGMMVNPATLSLGTAKSELLIGLDVLTTDISARNLDTGEKVSSDNESHNRGPYFAPQFAFIKRIDNFSLGFGAFAQAGVGVEYGKTSFLSRGDSGGVGYGGNDTGLENASRFLILDIPLAASYQLTDALAVGLTLDAKWTGLNLDYLLGSNQLASLAGSGRASGSLMGLMGSLPSLQGVHLSVSKDKEIESGASGWGYSGRIGMLYKVNSTTNMGLSYMFKSNMNDVEGNATVTAVDGIAGHIPISGKFKLRNFNTPPKLDFGISHQFSDNLLLALDISRVFWRDTLKDIKIKFTSGMGNVNLRLPQNAKNQTIVAVGAAYRMTPKFTLRAGYRQATQPLDDDALLALIPATLEKHGTLGFSYDFSKNDRVDFAYSHAFNKKMTNRSDFNTSAPVRSSISQDNFVLSYSHSF